MTTLIHRALGPDKKAAEMSDSDERCPHERASRSRPARLRVGAKVI